MRNEYRLFEGRVRIDEAMILLDETAEISRSREWNTYFSIPDIGQYPNLSPLPKISWAGRLRSLLNKED